MQNVNIHAAKTQLSQLVANVVRGERYVIAKAGKPQAMLVPISTTPAIKVQRIGFLTHTAKIPDDFNQMGQKEILDIFGISE